MALNWEDHVRLLIWDKDKEVFTTQELEALYRDTGKDIYATAALALEVVRANPERVQSYQRGGVTINLPELDRTIDHYRALTKQGANIGTVPVGKRKYK